MPEYHQFNINLPTTSNTLQSVQTFTVPPIYFNPTEIVDAAVELVGVSSGCATSDIFLSTMVILQNYASFTIGNTIASFSADLNMALGSEFNGNISGSAYASAINMIGEAGLTCNPL